MTKQSKQSIEKKHVRNISTLWIAAVVLVFIALVAASANSFAASADTTRPTIVSVSPANIEKSLPRNQQITVMFSEAMNPLSINANTFTVMQRTTPMQGSYRYIVIPGKISYFGNTATFTPNIILGPNQQYGNVFTVTISAGAMDLAGNSLSRDYVWSFTTGGDVFNTDATTSQADQSLASISGSVALTPTVQTSTQPLVTTPTGTETQSNFPWVYIFGALFLLVLIAVIYAFIMNPAPKNAQDYIHPNPFGDVYPVIALEGIGPEHNKELNRIGIKNTKQLWEADPVKVARQTGAPLSSVQSWQSMAELASVKDIGPQYAELLERSGIHSIQQLKSTSPHTLLRLVREKQDSLKINIQGNTPGVATVEHWITEANDHNFTREEATA